MKKYVRLLCAVLAVLMFVPLFTGCGEKESNTGDVTTVTIWSNNQHSRAFYEREVKNFNETIGKDKGIKIEYTIMNDLSSQMDLALANGTAPDFITGIPMVRKQAEEGTIIPLDTTPEFKELAEKFDEFKQYNGLDDHVYQLPGNTTTYGLVYNKDMFKAAGIVDENGEPTPPKTLDELIEYAKKLTNPDKKQYGIIFPVKWGSWMASEIMAILMPSTGYDGFNPEEISYDWTGLAPIMDKILQLKKDGSIYPGADSIDNDKARAIFAQGSVGMKFAASYDVGVFNDQFPAQCDWGVAPIPTLDDENVYKQKLTLNYSYCINSKSYKEKGGEALATVYEWLKSDEMTIKLCEEGYEIPFDTSLIDKMDFSKSPKGWEGFVKLLEVSTVAPQVHGFELENNKPIANVLLDDVWQGGKDAYALTKAANKYYNVGIKKRQEIMPEYDTEKFRKTWNIEDIKR